MEAASSWPTRSQREKTGAPGLQQPQGQNPGDIPSGLWAEPFAQRPSPASLPAAVEVLVWVETGWTGVPLGQAVVALIALGGGL